jgi:hypothetical protein
MMGTNYYHRTDICAHCNRYNEKHIGKNSAGWQFCFQGYNAEEHRPAIMSFEDWKKELKAEGLIYNEYGKEIPFEDFVKFVEEQQTNKLNKNHCDSCLLTSEEYGYDMRNDWKDKEGYSFSSREFL